MSTVPTKGCAIENDVADFVLVDVRSEELFGAGNIAAAVHLPHARITSESLPPLPDNAIYVVYCAGPHCNGANKAAVRIASLGLPVKEMIGGIEGWKEINTVSVVDIRLSCLSRPSHRIDGPRWRFMSRIFWNDQIAPPSQNCGRVLCVQPGPQHPNSSVGPIMK